MEGNKLVEVYNFLKEIYPHANHVSVEMWPGGIKTEVRNVEYRRIEQTDKIFDLMDKESEEI
jgi:hypothetical protein